MGIAIQNKINIHITYSNTNNLVDLGIQLQSAIDSLGSIGGTIVVGPGNWALSSVPKLPPELVDNLYIYGYGVNVALTENAPRFLDLNKTSDNQNFRKYRIFGFTIDAADILLSTNPGHVLLGSKIGPGFIGRFNAEDWLLQDITVLNVPSNYDAGVGAFHGVFMLTPYHSAADQSPQNTVTKITLKNVIAYGGDSGFQINAFCAGATSANVYFDDINIINCAHYRQTPSPSYYQTSNVHIGGYGFGNNCTIENFTGTGSSDNFIELNAMQTSFLDNLHGEGFYTYGLYAHNYHAAQDVDTQKILVGKHTYTVTRTGARAFSFGTENSEANPFGNINLGDMFVIASGWTAGGTAVHLRPSGAGTKNCKSFSMNSLNCVIDLGAQVVGDNYFPSVLSISNSVEAPYTIDKFVLNIKGSPTLGGSNNFPRVFEFYQTARIKIKEIDINNQVNFSIFWMNYITSSGGLDIRQHNALFKSSADSNTSYRIESTPFDATHGLILSNCDLVGTSFYTAIAEQAYFVKLSRCNFGTALTNGSITVTASPFTHTNSTYSRYRIIVTGGIISLFELSTDQGTAWTTISTTTTSIDLEHGWAIRITYSVAPTLYRLINPY